MGLTKFSTGKNAVDKGIKLKNGEPVIALAGNPNVGKSSVFNILTGLRQHTGNWAGKTVALCTGRCRTENGSCNIVDLPGCYSLNPDSEEEKAAKDFLTDEKPDAVIIVCDAANLRMSISFVLQVLEINRSAVVCLNLIDETRKKGIKINVPLLSQRLGVPVVPCSAKTGEGIKKLIPAAEAVIKRNADAEKICVKPEEAPAENEKTENAGKAYPEKKADGNGKGKDETDKKTDGEKKDCGKTESEKTAEEKAAGYFIRAEQILKGAVKSPADTRKRDMKIDKVLTGKVFAFPVMFLLLTVVFYITIKGANYPSELLSSAFFRLEDILRGLFIKSGADKFLTEILLTGVYRTLAWVISVMLPPMAIFFPLFTLLEDLGYLPRAAFNLDRCFHKCGACGKQALTMCMGFGCNAAGVVGCRIISSPRERLTAILTNTFVPCNGRFPMLIAVISLFFGAASGYSDMLAAGALAFTIVFSVFAALLVSLLLSKTLLRGEKSGFTLELPPYRKPRVGQVIVRSIFDRTLCVLARAAVIAAPAGLIIFLLANIRIGNSNLINIITNALDPFGHFLGLDGVILLAFILGFPANELVIPLMLMMYTAGGSLTQVSSLSCLHNVLIENGWNAVTAVSFILLALMHAPCGTTCLTIRKETGSFKWMLLSILIPTLCGIIACALFNGFACLVRLK